MGWSYIYDWKKKQIIFSSSYLDFVFSTTRSLFQLLSPQNRYEMWRGEQSLVFHHSSVESQQSDESLLIGSIRAQAFPASGCEDGPLTSCFQLIFPSRGNRRRRRRKNPNSHNSTLIPWFQSMLGLRAYPGQQNVLCSLSHKHTCEVTVSKETCCVKWVSHVI